MLLVTVLLVPVLAFAGVLAFRTAAAERARFEQEILDAASRVAGLIDRHLAGLQIVLQTLSTSAQIPVGEYEAFQRQALQVRDFTGEHIVLRDLSGQQLANTRVPWGAPLPRAVFEPDTVVMATKGPVISDVFTGAVAAAPLIAVVVPVLRDGEVTHLLNLSIPTERLVPLLREGLKPEWASGAFDRTGVFISRSERHGEVSGRPGPRDFLDRVSGPDGLWRGTGLLGVPVLSGHARSTLTGWRVWTSAPLTVIEAPLTRALKLLAILGAILIGASLVMAYAVGSQIAGSIKRLAANAASLGKAETVLPARGSVREANEVMQALSAASIGLRERALERDRAEAAMRASEEQFRTLADHIPQLAWMANADGWIFWYNQRWYDYTGTTPKDMEGWGWRSVHDPRTLPEVVERWSGSIASGQHFDMVFPLRAGDGTFRPFLTRVAPMRDGDGRVIRWFGTNTDISAERAAEERQELLINELNHRVKNTLATVQAIAAQTLRSSATDIEARDAFEARLMALSKVHNVLTRENWEGASLADIAAEVLAPHGGEGSSRFHIAGADVRLHPRMALPIAMALHELATNAVKYGALSNGQGRVSIAWDVSRVPNGPTLILRWAEEGGPPVSPPSRKGFGSRLIERSLAGELGGQVTIEYAASGVVCLIDAPLPNDAEGVSGAEAAAAEHARTDAAA